ncbi:MAG: NFACT family protein [Gammaproteobacteria bacterium]|nr:NFACT family protein [Gammaproteobacteria bacterium]
MSQDGIFIGKLAEELNNKLRRGRVDNVFDLNKTDYVLDIRIPGESYYLYTSVSYNNPTIFMTKYKFEKPNMASNFTMLLRKYLVGAYIDSIEQLDGDRVIKISMVKNDDLIGTKNISLIIELIGRFSNLLLLNEDEKIIDAIKQLSVLENNSRGIMRGLKYTKLINEKLMIDDEEGINKIFLINDNLYEQNLVNNISGVSPILAKYLVENYRTSSLKFYDFFKAEISKFDPVLTDNDFYFFDIFGEDKNKKHFDTLSEVLYEYYKKNALNKILKDNNSKVYQTISSNIKRIKKKIVNLSNDLDKDLNNDDLRIKGEILKANAYIEHPKSSKIKLLNFYDNKEVEIDVDPSKSIIDNSNNYFKRYKKSKAAIEHIEEQLELARNELDYFLSISSQLKNATLKDIDEIKAELVENKYLKAAYKGNSKKNKNQKPNFLEIKFGDCKIFVGKNNIQNNYITHKIAKKDDLWFHVKDSHGSHVLVIGDNKYDEDVIRKAALLAAKYSEASDSSSVPVDYTLVKYIKKVPGRNGSFVTYTHQKTIYVDPKRED